jgi:regulator of replication initiation timing
MSSENHGRLSTFLLTEWARKDNRQLVEVSLMYAPGGGFKNEPIRKWVRADNPEYFAEIVNVESLVSHILEIAESEADAKPAGKHRFIVRTQQHLGEQANFSIALQPSYTGSDDGAMVTTIAGGGGGRGGESIAAAQVLAGNNAQLMRTNTQMFDGTIRVLGQQTQNLHEQVVDLTKENAILRRELEEARSNKLDREFQIHMAAEKNNRTNAGFQKALQLGTVLVAKIAADKTNPGALGEGAPLPLLIEELKQSLRQDQMQAVMGILDMPQKIIFMEIINMATPKPPPGPPQGHPQANGAARPG